MSLIFDIHKSSGVSQEGVYEACTMDYGNEAISLYTEALDNLMGLDETFVKGTYNSIKHSNIAILSESTDEYIVGAIKSLESASFQMMKMFDHQIKYLNNVLDRNEKFLNKYEEYILSKDIKSFVYTGFWFTLDVPIPDTAPMDDFITSIKSGVKTLEALTKKDVQVCETEVSYSTYPDILRSKIIRSNKRKLDVDDYQIELYKIFRNGKQNPMSISIDKSDIATIMNKMRNLKTLIKSIVIERECLRDDYKAAISYLSVCRQTIEGAKLKVPTIYRQRGKGVVINPPQDIDTTTLLYDEDYYRYLMLVSRKAQLHFYMYNIAYGEKLVAIRDFCRQNIEIIIEYVKKGDE